MSDLIPASCYDRASIHFVPIRASKILFAALACPVEMLSADSTKQPMVNSTLNYSTALAAVRGREAYYGHNSPQNSRCWRKCKHKPSVLGQSLRIAVANICLPNSSGYRIEGGSKKPQKGWWLTVSSLYDLMNWAAEEKDITRHEPCRLLPPDTWEVSPAQQRSFGFLL